jgi:hypothetical protein
MNTKILPVLAISAVLFHWCTNPTAADGVGKNNVSDAVTQVNIKQGETLDKKQQDVLKSMVGGILKAEANARKIAELYLRVDNQDPADEIIVSYVNFDQNTFVAIKKPGTYGGEELMGVSSLLSAGKNENIKIRLKAKVTGTVLTAYLFIDNGDAVFDESADRKATSPMDNLFLCQDFDIRTRPVE